MSLMAKTESILMEVPKYCVSNGFPISSRKSIISKGFMGCTPMQVNKEDHLNMGIVTFPLLEAGIAPLSNLVEILYPLSQKLYLITGNAAATLAKDYKRGNIYFYLINHKTGTTNTFTRIMRFIYTQLRISYRLVKIRRHVHLWFLFLGEGGLLLPMLAAKLSRKKVILISASFEQKFFKANKDPLSWPAIFLEKLTRVLATGIVVYSERLIKEWNLEKYKNKISIAHRHFLDFDKFKVERLPEERGNLIGYIGRLSQAKGILNFMEAISKILERESSVEFFIGGDGQLRTKVEQYLSDRSLNNKAKFVGWIPHEKLPKYLNDLKLLVLPSYTEGLPNIMLEAMACGTVVLATPVGAMPDVIKDEETGFIMEDNSPECIARNIIRALNYPSLEEIARNARALVEKEFTYEVAVKAYANIVNSLQ